MGTNAQNADEKPFNIVLANKMNKFQNNFILVGSIIRVFLRSMCRIILQLYYINTSIINHFINDKLNYRNSFVNLVLKTVEIKL